MCWYGVFGDACACHGNSSLLSSPYYLEEPFCLLKDDHWGCTAIGLALCRATHEYVYDDSMVAVFIVLTNYEIDEFSVPGGNHVHVGYLLDT